MKCHHCDNHNSSSNPNFEWADAQDGFERKLCASKGVTNPENLSIGSLMEQDDRMDAGDNPMVCETCGTTHQDFKKVEDWDARRVIMYFVQF